MAAKKRKPQTATVGPNELIRAATRRRRALILPRLLREEAKKEPHHGADHDRAWGIVKRWADLEADGHLERKETSLDAEFLRDIFSEALGYKLVTDDGQKFQLDRQFSISGGHIADGAIGHFPLEPGGSPVAVIELKSADVDIDRDRSNGRTAVQQLWDYLNALPDCPWGIVSNFVTIRLYHRNKTPLAYEEFSLQGMRELSEFRQFWCLFRRHGLLDPSFGRPPYAEQLLTKTDERQREVGDELYQSYSDNRNRLIYHLHRERKTPIETAIRSAQKLLDRIIFIAFCEDRELLPENAIQKAFESVPQFERATNPRWRNFLNLFSAVDSGHPRGGIPHGYNGGLFRHDPDVDELQLDDEWTHFFCEAGSYDFKDEVNVDVLGHLFEKSITELEKIRLGGLFDAASEDAIQQTLMKKSARRKQFGIYYTPAEFTAFIVRNTLATLIEERMRALRKQHGLAPGSVENDDDAAAVPLWKDCAAALGELTVCDPACGSGAFLIAAYDVLEEQYIQIADHLESLGALPDAQVLRSEYPNMILADNLYGVDLSMEAVEITQLALWIRSARPGRTLADLSQNIVCGNSLVTDAEVSDRAMRWPEKFPSILDGDTGGFDCVIGNPPWERVKLQEREFFAFSAPDIAGAVNAATRRKLIAKLEKGNPALYAKYAAAKARAEHMLDYARQSGEYPLTGKGDVNYYVLFAELARKIVSHNGLVGLLTPSGIASDKTTRAFFNALIDDQSLRRLFDFENRRGIFADVHRSFKFCTLVFGGADRKTPSADFVFFAHDMDELQEGDRHIDLSQDDMALMNPNTRTCPIFRSRRDAEITRAVYSRVPVLIDRTRKQGGNPWCVKFLRMFDQANDAEHFRTADELTKQRYNRSGQHWTKGKRTCLPLYEAKMVQAYDHRAAGVLVEKDNWVRQGQTQSTSLVAHQNREFTVTPRWWVDEAEVTKAIDGRVDGWFLCYKDVTSPTNERTMIAAMIPRCAVVNSAPILFFETPIAPTLQSCLLANLNAIAYDYVARQKVGGVHLNFFIVEQLPTLPPEAYADRCPWDKRKTLESWVASRVLKLTCTANDMIPLAEACGLKKRVHRWNPTERSRLRAELDAAYFILYGIARDDAQYILSTFTGTRRRDEAATGNFQTEELTLAAYDDLAAKP